MNENVNTNDQGAQGFEANNPSGEQRFSPTGKLKEYGTKAYGPIIQVVTKYQDEITPYLSAVIKGLQGGVDALSQESSSAQEQVVRGWLQEATSGLEEARAKLESKDVKSLVSFIEGQANRHPSIMFSASYVAGLFLGRIGCHIGRHAKDKVSSTVNETTTSYQGGLDSDQSTLAH